MLGVIVSMQMNNATGSALPTACGSHTISEGDTIEHLQGRIKWYCDHVHGLHTSFLLQKEACLLSTLCCTHQFWINMVQNAFDPQKMQVCVIVDLGSRERTGRASRGRCEFGFAMQHLHLPTSEVIPALQKKRNVPIESERKALLTK